MKFLTDEDADALELGSEKGFEWSPTLADQQEIEDVANEVDDAESTQAGYAPVAPAPDPLPPIPVAKVAQAAPPPVEAPAEAEPEEESAPEALPEMPKAKPTDKYASMLEEYSKLQKQSAREQALNGIIRASQKMGQAFAGSVNGNFKVDPTGMDALDKLAQRGPQDFVDKAKMEDTVTSLKDADQMRNPESKVSVFYRLMARQRGLEVDDSMSAWDIAQMSKVMGKPSTAGERTQLKTIIVDGKNTLVNYNPVTQKITGLDGQPVAGKVDPFIPPSVGFDPASGAPMVFNRNNNTGSPVSMPTPSMAPPPKPEGAVAPKPRTRMDIYNEVINKSPNDSKKIETVQKEFEGETALQNNILTNADEVKTQLKDALTNPQVVPAVRAALAYMFEKAPRSDEDFQRYVSEQGILTKLESILPKNFEGTLSEKQVDGLNKMLDGTKQAAYKIMKKKRYLKAKNMGLAIKGVSQEDKEKLISELPGENMVPAIDAKTGAKVKVPSEKYDELKRKGLIK